MDIQAFLAQVSFWIATLVVPAFGQSCGPRVSARLLAEIPCDMSRSGYCSAPGSAYPWSSVKRYINDNQGLVRRMYGDEKHSSVLLNEIDGFQQKFDALRQSYGAYRSRTVYGRSSGGNGRLSRRRPRPQLFEDDELSEPTPSSEPATIFRVVTETSIKVGDDPTTQAMRPTTSDHSQQATVTTSTISNHRQQPTATTTTTSNHQQQSTLTTSTEPTVSYEPASEFESQHPSEIPTDTTTQSWDSTTKEKTTQSHELPIALERIGYADFEEDYEFEPTRKKTDTSVLLNSLEEKVRDEDYKTDQEKKPLEEEEVVEEESTEVPRRGINACPVKNEVIAPYWANNTRGETLALLNVHPFEQYVHFEKCAFENHQMLCREGCRCEQQYRLHRLLAFDPKNECRGIFSDWFRFPSCCVCICYDLTPDIPRKGRI